MAKPWAEVEASDSYKSLDDTDKATAKKQYFEEVVAKKPEYEALPEPDKLSARQEFLGVEPTELANNQSKATELISAATVQPAQEVWRGVQHATSRFYRGLDNIQTIGYDRPTEYLEQVVGPARKKILDAVTGRPSTPEQQEQINLSLRENQFKPFKAMERIAEQAADSVPRSPLTDTFVGSAYNFIGEMPVSMGEFLTTKGIVGGASLPSIQSMKTMATIGAIQEADKGPVEAAKGAVKGAAMDTAFGVGMTGLTKAYQAGKTFGKAAFTQWMRALGVSQDSINAFLKNPSNFKLWGKVEDYIQAKDKGHINIEEFKSSTRDAASELKTLQQAERFELTTKHTEEATQLRDRFNQRISSAQNEMITRLNAMNDAKTQATTNLKNQKAGQIDGLTKIVNDRATKAGVAVREDLLAKTESSFAQVELMKKQAGDNVGLAVEQVLKENPFAEVSAAPVLKDFQSTFKEYGFNITPVKKIVGKGEDAVEEVVLQLEPKIAGVDTTELNRVNSIFQQMQKTVTEEGGLTIAYMQDLKSALQKLALPKNSANPTPWESMYSKLAGKSNVANMENAVSPELKAAMKPVFDANKQYRLISGERNKLYDLMGRKTTVTDPATGFTIEKVVPDVEKLLKIRDNQLIDIRRLNEADKILPDNLKIVNQANKAIENIKSIDQAKKASLNSIRKRVDSELAGMTKRDMSLMEQHRKELARIKSEQKTALSGLQQKQAEQKLEQSIRLRKQTEQFSASKRKEMLELRNGIDNELAFLKNQQDVRALIPEGLFGKGMQAIAGAGILRGDFSGIPMMIGASPRVLATGQRIVASANQSFESAARIAKQPAENMATALKIKILQDKHDNETIDDKIRRRAGIGG